MTAESEKAALTLHETRQLGLTSSLQIIMHVIKGCSFIKSCRNEKKSVLTCYHHCPAASPAEPTDLRRKQATKADVHLSCSQCHVVVTSFSHTIKDLLPPDPQKISVKPFCMDPTSRKEMSSLRTWLKLVSIGEGRGQIPSNVNSLLPSNNTEFSESNEHCSHSYGAWDVSWCNEQLPVTLEALCEQDVTIWDTLHSFKPFSIFITDRMMLHKASGSWEPAQKFASRRCRVLPIKKLPTALTNEK